MPTPIDTEIDTLLGSGQSGGVHASPLRTVLHDMVTDYTAIGGGGGGGGTISISDAIFNVQDYGATGDGTTNDHTAIAAAITAMTHGDGTIIGKLYFPPLRSDGTPAHYNTSAPIVLGDGTQNMYLEVTGNITHVGNNFDICGTVWTTMGSVGFPASDDMFKVNPKASGDISSVAFRNLTMDANSDNTKAGLLIGPNQLPAFVMENVSITAGGYNIRFIGKDITNPYFRRCAFTNASIGAWGMNGGWQNGLIDHCIFDPTHSAAPHLLFEVSNGLNGNPVENTKFHKCVFEGTSGNSVQTNPGARQLLGLIFDSCWWEANAGAFFYINTDEAYPAMLATTFMHCHFVGTNSNANHIIYAKPGSVGGQSSNVIGVTFINSQVGALGASAWALNVDASPSNPTQTQFRDVADLDGTTLGVGAFNPAAMPFLRPSLGGSGTLYGFTPDISSGGHYPKFSDPKNGTFCEVPLTILDQDGNSITMGPMNYPNFAPVFAFTGSLGGIQFPPTPNDPTTTSWGATQKGVTWFNTTSNLWKGWNGSAIRTFTTT